MSDTTAPRLFGGGRLPIKVAGGCLDCDAYQTLVEERRGLYRLDRPPRLDVPVPPQHRGGVVSLASSLSRPHRQPAAPVPRGRLTGPPRASEPNRARARRREAR